MYVKLFAGKLSLYVVVSPQSCPGIKNLDIQEALANHSAYEEDLH